MAPKAKCGGGTTRPSLFITPAPAPAPTLPGFGPATPAFGATLAVEGDPASLNAAIEAALAPTTTLLDLPRGPPPSHEVPTLPESGQSAQILQEESFLAEREAPPPDNAARLDSI